MSEPRSEGMPESHAAWCARIDADVEAEFAKLNPGKTPAPVAVSTPEAKPDPGSAPCAERARKELRVALRKMDKHDLTSLWALWQAIGPNCDGSATPIEEFISTVGHLYLFSLSPGGRGVTPTDIEGELETLRANFRDAVAITKRFNSKYSAEVKKA